MNWLLRCFILIGCQSLVSSASPKTSCRDHYLSGKFQNGVFPISTSNDGASEVFMLECLFPEDGGTHHPVTTIVHSALERWKPVTKKRTVGYQISNREFLQKLISDSHECVQVVLVKWLPNFVTNDEFTIESISGRQHTFRRNSTKPPEYMEALSLMGENAGLIHVLPSLENVHEKNATVWVKTNELKCTQKVLKEDDCLFELNALGDRIRFAGIAESDEFIRFSFRTDQPWTRFFTLYFKGAPHINVDIVDGYLLSINNGIPVKFLSDGNWHSVHIDLRVLTLTIDDSDTVISLHSGRMRTIQVEYVDVFVSGQVTALEVGEEGNTEWQCADSDRLQIQSTPQILRRICPTYEANYCKCRGPNSALSSFRHKIMNCSEPESQAAYRLTRNSHRLAFFYLRDLNEKARISVLFKSDSDVGLVLFGMVLKPRNQEEFVTRIQVHYINDVMYAARCIRDGKTGSEKCHSCSIRRKGGFSSNEWIRVSVFSYNVYQLLTVDHDVCQLSPNSGAILDSSELYSPPTYDTFLFVGGYPYAKSSHTFHQMNPDFKKKYGENTREKPPSLRGCISEITIDGIKENLDEVFKNTIKDVAREGQHSLFSIKRGCDDCENSAECHGARCRSSYPDIADKPSCDCASIFANNLMSAKRTYVCVVNQHQVDGVFGKERRSLSLSSTKSLKLESNRLSLNRRAVVDKIWFLMKFPEENEGVATILTFGSIKIRVGSYGKRVIIEVDFLKEEFNIQSNDERLHLIAIQKNKMVGTAIEHKSLKIQIDNDVRTVYLDEIPISDPYLLITPIIAEKVGENTSGCLAEFVVSYDYREDAHSHIPSPENRAEQTDWLPTIIDQIRDSDLILNDYCGIRDPTLWTGNSSSYGIVGEHDPYGGQAGTSKYTIFAIIIVLLILLCCIPYCICRQKRYKKYKAQKESKLNGKSLREERAEKMPLTDESYMEVPRETKMATKQNGVNGIHREPSETNGEIKMSYEEALRSARVSIREPPEEPIRISDYPTSPGRPQNRPILVRRMPPPSSPRIIDNRANPNGTFTAQILDSVPGSLGIPLQPQYATIQKAPIARSDEL